MHRCGSASSPVRRDVCVGWRSASTRGQPFTAPAAPLLRTDCARTRCKSSWRPARVLHSHTAAFTSSRVLSTTPKKLYTVHSPQPPQSYDLVAFVVWIFLPTCVRRAQSKEPERTERLLANPLALFPPVGSDAFESIAVTVLFKCRGDRKHLGYHLFKLTAQDMP